MRLIKQIAIDIEEDEINGSTKDQVAAEDKNNIVYEIDCSNCEVKIAFK